ncbi:SDR family NAD(P)-dependent oxidoreductase [Tardibacter chloracetimidivorans]|uniref:SDR family NAD(P)-dependent oxidoreductase n=1 Tax=Tardibacter chloracetimidivorans TaxID=1921510 RepID=UPI0009FA2650|nr:SDR family NAD(P)-dependent oxidoreductase [Tardibacter chloracetimidivorans]
MGVSDPASLFGIESRVALVTGATSGLGRAIAEGLARAGATVYLNGRDPARCADAAEELRAAGLAVLPLAFEIGDEGAMDRECGRWRHPAAIAWTFWSTTPGRGCGPGSMISACPNSAGSWI